MFDGHTIARLRNIRSIFFPFDVDFCVGGAKVNKGDVACKGKSDGKAMKFYILCNFKINVLHFKMESKQQT